MERTFAAVITTRLLQITETLNNPHDIEARHQLIFNKVVCNSCHGGYSHLLRPRKCRVPKHSAACYFTRCCDCNAVFSPLFSTSTKLSPQTKLVLASGKAAYC